VKSNAFLKTLKFISQLKFNDAEFSIICLTTNYLTQTRYSRLTLSQCIIHGNSYSIQNNTRRYFAWYPPLRTGFGYITTRHFGYPSELCRYTQPRTKRISNYGSDDGRRGVCLLPLPRTLDRICGSWAEVIPYPDAVAECCGATWQCRVCVINCCCFNRNDELLYL